MTDADLERRLAEARERVAAAGNALRAATVRRAEWEAFDAAMAERRAAAIQNLEAAQRILAA